MSLLEDKMFEQQVLNRTADSIFRVCGIEGKRKGQEYQSKCKKEGILGGFKKEYNECMNKGRAHMHSSVRACLERNIKDCHDERCRTIIKHYIAGLTQEAKKIKTQLHEDNNMDKIQLAEQKLDTLLFEMESKEVKDKIIKWFIDNPYPQDEKIHNLAGELGIEPDKFESIIYGLLSDFLSGGRSKGFKGNYDPEQIKMGIEVEKEHIDNELIATKIAQDHLAEIPDYYTRLKKMEGSAGIKESTDDIEEQSASMYAMKNLGSQKQASLAKSYGNSAAQKSPTGQAMAKGAAVAKNVTSKIGGFFK
jgi:hypothetical protein